MIHPAQSMATLHSSTTTTDLGVDPEDLAEFGLDPQTLKDIDLDPRKTMDFALFGEVCCESLIPGGSHEAMAMYLRCNFSEDTERLPPLTVILYEDLVQPAWGWDRLLPWTRGGYVLFQDYFRYLERFFLRNVRHVSGGLRAAASQCVEAEDALSGVAAGMAGPTAAHHELSKKIKDQALLHLVARPDLVPYACLVCIVEEARLLSDLLRKRIATDYEPEAKRLEERIEFGNEVRKVVLDILTTYRGPYIKQITAAMLGMKTEAKLHLHLRRYDERLDICAEILASTLELLKIIRDRFPRDSAIDYRPIEHARSHYDQ